MTAHRLHAALARADKPMPPAQQTDWRTCNPNDHLAEPFAMVGVSRNANIHAGSSLALYVTPEILTDFFGLVDTVATFLAAYFQLSVTPCTAISLNSVPLHNQRQHQLRTAALLDPLGTRYDPASKRLVLTSRDIYHDDFGKFVFGLADVSDSKAVVSLYRYGIRSDAPLTGIPLSRLLKVASHEVGHLYYLRHCTAALCNMNGKNSTVELDSHPIELCSQCLSTLLWFIGADPQKRFSDLHNFYAQHGLIEEMADISSRISLLNEAESAFGGIG